MQKLNVKFAFIEQWDCGGNWRKIITSKMYNSTVWPQIIIDKVVTGLSLSQYNSRDSHLTQTYHPGSLRIQLCFSDQIKGWFSNVDWYRWNIFKASFGLSHPMLPLKDPLSTIWTLSCCSGFHLCHEKDFYPDTWLLWVEISEQIQTLCVGLK